MKAVFIDGSSSSINVSTLPAIVKRVIDFLDCEKENHFYSRSGLAEKLNVKFTYVCNYVGHNALNKYKIRVGPRVYYGNPKGIAKLRKELEGKKK